jgi:ABC-2 type transport system permease protein
VLPADSVDAVPRPRVGWTVAGVRFVAKTIAIAEMEMWKLRHDPTELLARSVQPALWLLVFGQIFTRVEAIPTGGVRYLDFMAPGILAQSVLFIAIFYGIAIIWERDLGIIHKFLASPTPRAALVLGKALSAGVRGLSQAAIIYLLSVLLGVAIDWRPLSLLGVAAAVVLGAAFFATMSLIVACVVKTRERFMGMGQLMTMPLFFASNAIYPISLMPRWLQVVARLNPLTYEVDALRALMLAQGSSSYGLTQDFGVLLGATALLVALGAWMYPRVAR